MRKDNSTLLKKLKQYSALVGPALAIAGTANAQILYTDVDPDVTVAPDAGAQDGVALDLNGDGTTDFVFQAGNSFVQSGGTVINSVGAYPYTSNEIIGNVNGNFQYPAALNFQDPIDSNQDFFANNGFLATMAFSFVTSQQTYGNWIDVTDKYLGFYFIDASTNLHYGWIRMDVTLSPASFTIKDFAYNDTPDEGLFAGQNPLGVQPIASSNEFGVFGFEGVANIIIKDGRYDNTSITVINTMGQKVVDQKAMDKITRIDLNQFGKGLYVVTIQRGSEQFSKKISFR